MPAFLTCRRSITDSRKNGDAAAMDHASGLLLSCFRNDLPEAALEQLRGLPGSSWEGLVQAALSHNLAPFLYHSMRPLFADLTVPLEVQQRLKEAYFRSAARNMRIYNELSSILRSFNAAGVPVILLKGVHLAELVYGNIALRPMGDVDLLVKHPDLLHAHELLVAQGYAAPPQNTGNALWHLPPYNKTNSPTVEIHYNIVNPPLSQRFAVEELWERARPVAIQGVEALTLCPEDLLLHLCAHTAIDHGLEIGLLPFFDIARIIEHYRDEIDWDRLLHRAGQWGLRNCVYLVLSLSKKMAGLSLPEHLLADSMPDAPAARELAAAEELVFEGCTPVASDIARLFGNESLAVKLRYCLRQIFPAGEAMRVVHPQVLSRLSLFVQYLFRIKGLCKMQGRIACLLLLRDKKMREYEQIENRRNKLKDWLLLDTQTAAKKINISTIITK